MSQSIDLNAPTPSEMRRAGEYLITRGRAWKPSPQKAAAMRAHVLKRDDYTCQDCGYRSTAGYRLELDHIKPYKEGGHFVASNLQVLCQSCNVRKGAQWRAA